MSARLLTPFVLLIANLLCTLRRCCPVLWNEPQYSTAAAAFQSMGYALAGGLSGSGTSSHAGIIVCISSKPFLIAAFLSRSGLQGSFSLQPSHPVNLISGPTVP